jgi:O-antigen/teichoic acid export membrane protein
MIIFRSAARNVSIVAGSHMVMWAATLLFTVAQARLLGPVRFGELSLALAYALFLTIVIDFGLGIQLSRMVAQRSGDAEALAATILLRVALWIVAVPCLMLVTIAFAYEAELQLTILVLAVSVLFVGISASIEAFLRGHEQFLLPSIGAVAYRTTAAAVGIALLMFGAPLAVVAGAFLVGAAANLAVLLVGLRGRATIGRKVDPQLAARLFRAAIPLGLWWIIAAFVFSTDLVIMELRAPAENVGWYAAAYRLFNVATIFPAITVGMVLSPVLSRLSLGPRDELRRVLEKALMLLIISGVGIALVMAVFADGIIAALYPAESYAAAASALRLLAPRLAFLYVNSALLYALLALHQERRLLLMAITFAVINPVANFIVIPVLRQDGAALVSSMTELCWLVWFVAIMPKDLITLESARLAAKAVAAAVVAALIGLSVAERGLLVAVPIALATYAALVLVLGGIQSSDTRALGGLVRRRTAASDLVKTVGLPAREEVA